MKFLEKLNELFQAGKDVTPLIAMVENQQDYENEDMPLVFASVYDEEQGMTIIKEMEFVNPLTPDEAEYYNINKDNTVILFKEKK